MKAGRQIVAVVVCAYLAGSAAWWLFRYGVSPPSFFAGATAMILDQESAETPPITNQVLLSRAKRFFGRARAGVHPSVSDPVFRCTIMVVVHRDMERSPTLSTTEKIWWSINEDTWGRMKPGWPEFVEQLKQHEAQAR